MCMFYVYTLRVSIWEFCTCSNDYGLANRHLVPVHGVQVFTAVPSLQYTVYLHQQVFIAVPETNQHFTFPLSPTCGKQACIERTPTVGDQFPAPLQDVYWKSKTFGEKPSKLRAMMFVLDPLHGQTTWSRMCIVYINELTSVGKESQWSRTLELPSVVGCWNVSSTLWNIEQ